MDGGLSRVFAAATPLFAGISMRRRIGTVLREPQTRRAQSWRQTRITWKSSSFRTRGFVRSGVHRTTGPLL